MTTYAVGDIQGCYSALRRLLDKIRFDEQRDKLWVAGDMVNRGPDSLNTLRYLKSLGNNCKAVLGNHDLHLLAMAAGARDPKPSDTAAAVLDAPDAGELLDWLRHRPLVHLGKKKRCLMVHAGVPPIWDENTILKRAAELEAVLQCSESDRFLQQLYGSLPDRWSDDLRGYDRLRIIANYFTRMRFCRADGRLDLVTKGKQAPMGFAPWFAHNHSRDTDLTVIFGHWAALKGRVDEPGYEALDTGCVWGEQLTAMRIQDRKRFSVDADQ